MTKEEVESAILMHKLKGAGAVWVEFKKGARLVHLTDEIDDTLGIINAHDEIVSISPIGYPDGYR